MTRSLLLAYIAILFLVFLAAAQTGTAQTNAAGQTPAQPPTAQADLNEATELSKSVVQLYKAQKFDEAIPLAERALALREKALGPQAPEVAGALSNLAVLYQATGKLDRAEALNLRALSIYEQASGGDRAHLADVLYHLAEIRSQKKDFNK